MFRSSVLMIVQFGNGVKDPRQKFRVESHVTLFAPLEGDIVFRRHNTLRRVVECNQGDASNVRGQAYMAMENFEKPVSLCYINGYT